MSPPPGSPILDTARAQLAIFKDRDAELRAAEIVNANATARLAALRERLAALEADAPAQEVAFTDDHAAQLARDPSATFEPAGDIAQQRAAFTAARSTWQAEVAALRQAVEQAEPDAATAALDLEARRDARSEALSDLLFALHRWLMGRFEEAFTLLRRDLLNPMRALESYREGGPCLLDKPLKVAPRVDPASWLQVLNGNRAPGVPSWRWHSNLMERRDTDPSWSIDEIVALLGVPDRP